MTMSAEAYADMIRHESMQRNVHASQQQTLALVTKMFVQHLYNEHKLGYKQIGKRLNLKWTEVKELLRS